jgi:cysteine desulfurase family protein (TIGR01976 family)
MTHPDHSALALEHSAEADAAGAEAPLPYDVRSVRAHFPALAEGAAHFDGPGGSQVPDVVADAVAATLSSAIANRGRTTPAERRADDIVVSARHAMADLLAVDPRTVVFGRSMTQLTFDVSRAMAKEWGPGDEVVVTRLDHDANIRPWTIAAEAAGATVRWADFDPTTGRLDPDDIAAVLSPRTRLVAVTAASNLIGTQPDIAEISRLVHEVGALLYVDGVHFTPHAVVDVGQLGADLFACSPYKFFGPHCGVLAGSLDVLEAIHPDKLLPSSNVIPERFEFGTLPYELLAGVTAAVDFIAGLASHAGGSRRERLVNALTGIESYEDGLRVDLEARLSQLPALVSYSRAPHRTPTLLIELAGRRSADAQLWLADRLVNAPAGSFYALEASRVLGLGDTGALRIGLAPYTDTSDIDRLVDGLSGFAFSS